MSELPRNRVLIGDVRELMPTLPAESVDSVITSPPYFGLRDYGHAAQLGLERNVDEWVNTLRMVCRELARLLTPAGSLWLNVGDGYSSHPREGAPKKALLLGPQRLAIALSDDGWLIRNQIVWAKLNGMPNSTRDRLTNRHELLFFLVRRPHYYFDLDAIRIPVTHLGPPRNPREAQYPPPGAAPRNVDENRGLTRLKQLGLLSHPLGKNPGDVWQTATASFRGAHFATFPDRLLRTPLLATCPERLCVACGTPWRRTKQRLHGRLLAVGSLRPDCTCHADWRPGLVLDPFMGSGTVALAAEKHQRDWLGCELNPAYAALAERRVADWRTSRNSGSAEDCPA